MIASTSLKTEDLLQLVMDNIPAFIFWKDRNSIYLGCNMNFALSAGLNNPKEIIGKSDYDLPWSKEDSDFYRAVDKKVMDAGKSELNFEESQTAKDGSKKWLRTSKIPLYDDANNVIGILGTYEDITAKKEMELQLLKQAEDLKVSNEELKNLNFKLEELNIDLEQFAYAASHDLQEPLRMVGGFVGLVRKKYSPMLDAEGLEYVDYIGQGVNRMSDLIRNILLFSKVEKDIESLEKVDINEILHEKIKDITHVLQESNVDLEINLPDKKIKCQPIRIGILFYNLILNGIKFNRSEKPRILINFEEQETQWLFRVSDNGIGIEEEYQAEIFHPFKRLNSREYFSGSGIGLSICKRIVQLHGGKIWCESNDLGGTDFKFTIQK